MRFILTLLAFCLSLIFTSNPLFCMRKESQDYKTQRLGHFTITNALNEPIEAVVTKSFDYYDRNHTINTSLSSFLQTLRPGHTRQLLNSDQDQWDSDIHLTLSQPDGPELLELEIHDLGTYVVDRDKQGNIILEKQN